MLRDMNASVCTTANNRMVVDKSLIKGIDAAKMGLPLNSVPTFKQRMDADIARVAKSLVNLLQRRYGDSWREKLAEFVR